MFEDRYDAGKRLAEELKSYAGKEVLVLGIPHGGLEVGYAVAEDGSEFIFDFAPRIFSAATIDRIITEQKREAQKRVRNLRGGKALPSMKGRTVILVDDGLAMGATMRAAVMMCRKAGAAKIVVAVPVSGMAVAEEFEKLADELHVLEIPDDFHAVAQVYEHWHDVSPEEALQILTLWERESGSNRAENK